MKLAALFTERLSSAFSDMMLEREELYVSAAGIALWVLGYLLPLEVSHAFSAPMRLGSVAFVSAYAVSFAALGPSAVAFGQRVRSGAFVADVVKPGAHLLFAFTARLKTNRLVSVPLVVGWALWRGGIGSLPRVAFAMAIAVTVAVGLWALVYALILMFSATGAVGNVTFTLLDFNRAGLVRADGGSPIAAAVICTAVSGFGAAWASTAASILPALAAVGLLSAAGYALWRRALARFDQ